MDISAFVLDQAIPKRYSDLVPFLDGRPVLDVIQAAMQCELRYISNSELCIEEVSRLIAMHVSGQSDYTIYEHSYHPFLWWSTIRSERESVFSEGAMRVFSLSTISFVVELSFIVQVGYIPKHEFN